MKTLWRLLRESFAHWNEVKAQRLGAALAYYTVFSLAPLLIIAILIAGAVFGQAAAQERIVGQITALVGPQGAAGVASLIEQHPFPGNSGGIATVVSVVTLILGAIGLFGQLEDAFDTVWDITPPRAKDIVGLVKQRILPFGMVLAVCFLLLVGLLLNTALAAISAYMGPYIPFFALINTGVNFILPIAVSTLLFAALFKFVPHVHLTWRHLWPGALMTAVLFTLGKILIGLYLGHSSLASASGAAGSLLVVLVWVYYSAQILLFGAVFTHVYSRYKGWQPTPAEAARTGANASTPAAPDGRASRPNPATYASEPTAAAVADLAPRPDFLGAILGFVAGLGAGAMMAANNARRSHLSR
jgi:membrane protein